MKKIPSFLYGKFADVKRETSKVISQLKKGVSIKDIIANYEFIKISSGAGKIILNGPNPSVGGKEHFNLFILPRLLLINGLHSDPKNDQWLQELFDEMMKNFWSHMVLSCGQNVYPFYKTENNRMEYLKYMIKYKNNYERVNDYFDDLPLISWNLNGELSNNIQSIFDHPNFIAKYVIGNLDYVKEKFTNEEIQNLLVKRSLFDCIETFEVNEYLQK